MATLHKYVDGSFGIGHIINPETQKCICNPVRTSDWKARTSGRGGRHQGYNVTVVWKHNALPVTV